MMSRYGPDRALLHTLRDTVAHHLRAEIVTGALRPNEIIKDVELATRLGISTTPVREALWELALERLIDMPPNRPKRVAPLSKRCAREMYAIVAALSTSAYASGVARVGTDDLIAMEASSRELADALASDDRHAALVASRGFHDRVVRAADNVELRRARERSFVWLERAFYAAPNVTCAHAIVADQAAALRSLHRSDRTAAIGHLEAATARFADVIETLAEE